MYNALELSYVTQSKFTPFLQFYEIGKMQMSFEI